MTPIAIYGDEFMTGKGFGRIVSFLDMNWQEHIAVNPAVLVGKPVVRGTRLAVEFILGLMAQGWPEEEIARNYRLTTEQVRACVAYAQERLSEEKVFAVGG